MNENNEFNDEIFESEEGLYQIVINDDLSDDMVDSLIEFNDEPVEDNKTNKKGIRCFVSIISFVVAISIAVACGYVAGQISARRNANTASHIELYSKEDAEKYSAEQIFQSVNKSIVGVVVYNHEGVKGHASGVIYSDDGYIISNDHIYDNVPNARFKIYTYDGKVYNGVFVAGDTRSDLSVIKVDAAGFAPATFGDSAEIVCGEQVLAIGRPSDATSSSSITSGIVSYINRRVRNSTNYASKLIQTDSAINPGSSGGALVNMYGQVIGITSSKLVGEDYEAIGYAIPSATVKQVVESLILNGEVVGRSRLGISYHEIDNVTAEINDSKIFGLQVAEVSQDSDLYGKVNKGDVITKINGKDIYNDEIMLDIIENNPPGTEVTLTIFTTNKKTITLKCKLLKYTSNSSYKTSQTPTKPNK